MKVFNDHRMNREPPRNSYIYIYIYVTIKEEKAREEGDKSEGLYLTRDV